MQPRKLGVGRIESDGQTELLQWTNYTTIHGSPGYTDILGMAIHT